MAPQFVKPYVKSNKNDQADAEAICEAVSRPNMRFVPVKSGEQQDILSIHRIRARLVKNRTALAKEIRGLLHEFGIIIPKGINKITAKLTEVLDSEKLSPISQQTFSDLKDEFIENKTDVLTAGCSISFGLGLPENGVWPNILQNTTKYNVNNISYPGYSIMYLCDNIIKYCEKFGDPKYIFCLFPDFFRYLFVNDPYFHITKNNSKDVDIDFPNIHHVFSQSINYSNANIVLTTGGTAKGPVDHIHPAIKALNGHILIDEVKVRPGHPMLLAEIGTNKFLVGLPGNPLAAVVAFISLAIPVIRKMQGRNLEKLAFWD